MFYGAEDLVALETRFMRRLDWNCKWSNDLEIEPRWARAHPRHECHVPLAITLSISTFKIQKESTERWKVSILLSDDRRNRDTVFAV